MFYFKIFECKFYDSLYFKGMSIKERNIICNKEMDDSVCGFLQARDAYPFICSFSKCNNALNHDNDQDPTQSPYAVSSSDLTAIQATNPTSSSIPSSNPTITISQNPMNIITTTPSLIDPSSSSSTSPTV